MAPFIAPPELARGALVIPEAGEREREIRARGVVARIGGEGLAEPSRDASSRPFGTSHSDVSS